MANIGRPSSYDPAYCERVVELGAEGKSPVQIAVALGVSRTTMLSWADRHPEFSTALTRAKECEQDWWEGVGQSNLNADRFNAAVWSKTMSARFRQDYTDQSRHEVTGKDGEPLADTRQLARAIVSILSGAVTEGEEPT